MYTFEYKFYPKSFGEAEISEFDERMQWFITSLYKNGQILRDFQNTIKKHDCYMYRVVAPEKTSLNKKLYNKYVRKFLEEVIERSVKPPTVSLIGENYDTMDCCLCTDSKYYILDTDMIDYESPIRCGDCGRQVPLYRFPKTYEGGGEYEEYYDLLNWQWVYRSCWAQFWQGIGERHGYRMMHSYKSDLAIEGRRLCGFLEEHAKKPFYYYLFKYYSKNRKTCPSCGQEWLNKDEDFMYDCVCHKCRLVSNNY